MDAVFEVRCHVNERAFASLLLIRAKPQCRLAFGEVEECRKGRCMRTQFLSGRETELDHLGSLIALNRLAEDTLFLDLEFPNVSQVDVLLFRCHDSILLHTKDTAAMFALNWRNRRRI